MFTLLDRSLRTVLDVAVLSIAYWLAFLFRFELQITHAGAGVLFVSWPYVIVLQYAALAAWGIPRMAWRYVSMVDGERHRVLLIGAGEAGVIVLRELMNRPDLGLVPVGFVDDNASKLGTHIGGLQVLGKIEDVAQIAERKRAKRALITIANASGADMRRITNHCREAGLDTKIIPGIYEIVGDKVNLSRIREVAIEDLLGREPVSLDESIIASTIRSRTVLVTGAGGSIGSELCRQVCRFGPERLILVERIEHAQFDIHRELASSFPH